MGEGRLAGKVAVVVGAGQQPGETLGNGRAVAEQFAREGASVLLVDNDAARVAATLNAVTSDGGTASILVADITREDDCREIPLACVDRYGRIDILHNNVGVTAGDRPTLELDVDVWDRLMTVNLKGMFMTCKHVIPTMVKQQSGSVINVSSVASIGIFPSVAYKTAKGAVNTLTQHLAIEHARSGVRVNCLILGHIDAPITIERRVLESGLAREKIREERGARVPLGFMGSAQDVAYAATFLASDEARYITGVLLPVDGGLLCKTA